MLVSIVQQRDLAVHIHISPIFLISFLNRSLVSESAGDARDLVSIPGLERSPGGRNGNPLRYSCLETLMD